MNLEKKPVKINPQERFVMASDGCRTIVESAEYEKATYEDPKIIAYGIETNLNPFADVGKDFDGCHFSGSYQDYHSGERQYDFGGAQDYMGYILDFIALGYFGKKKGLFYAKKLLSFYQKYGDGLGDLTPEYERVTKILKAMKE